jgi:hypothetical protein
MSAIGPKRTSLVAAHMSAFGGKADIIIPDPWVGGTKQNVRSEEPRRAEVRQELLDAFTKCVSGRQW